MKTKQNKFLETKKICQNSKSYEIAKRVIASNEPIQIRLDGITFSYNKETNLLSLTDTFGTTFYRPLILSDGTIFPFNKRVVCKDM